MIKKDRIAVLCPSVYEYRSLAALLKKRRVPEILSGMGKVRSLYACHTLLKRHPKLEWILLVGYAGALTGTLGVGDVVEPDLFIEQDYFAEPFEKFPNQIKKKNGRKVLPHSLQSVMLTQDRFLTENPYSKESAKPRYSRVACDMESYAVAHFCERSGIRYSSVKLISDRADGTADHDFLKACRELRPKLGRTVGECLDRISA